MDSETIEKIIVTAIGDLYLYHDDFARNCIKAGNPELAHASLYGSGTIF